MTSQTDASSHPPMGGRRGLLTGAAALVATGALGRPSTAAPRPLNAYFHKGKGAVSMLGNPEHSAEQAAMTGVFSGGKVTIDLESGRDSFLRQLFASDFAYLSLHANQRLVVVGNGDRVTTSELEAARRAAGKAPRLIIVAGCKTTGAALDADNVPQALGFASGARKQAYIGFHTLVVGISQDRYFRYFLPLWVNPGPGGAYRTLAQARTDAKELMERRYQMMKDGAAGGQQAGAALRMSPLDLKVTGNFDIVGDEDLRATDL